MRRALRVMGLVLLGCDQGGTLTVRGEPPAVEASDPTETGVPDPQCANPVTLWEPVPGTQDVAVDAPVRARLTTAEPSATLRLRAGDRDVPGRTAVDGAVVGFVPLDEVPAGEALQARLVWSCGTDTIGWRTAAPVFRWAVRAPERLAEALPALAVLAPLQVGLVSAGRGRATWRAEVLFGGAPEPCAPTFALTGEVAEDGRVAARGAGWWRVGDRVVALPAVVFAGRLSAGLTAWTDARMDVTLPLSGLVDDVGAACGALAEAGAGCRDCGAGRCAVLSFVATPVWTGAGGVPERAVAGVGCD